MSQLSWPSLMIGAQVPSFLLLQSPGNPSCPHTGPWQWQGYTEWQQPTAPITTTLS